jgi:hypothetical protein
MWTAVLATLNLIQGEQEHDVWSVNVEAEYLETGEAVDALFAIDLFPPETDLGGEVTALPGQAVA